MSLPMPFQYPLDRNDNTVLTPMTPSRLLLLHPTNSTYSSGDAFIVLRKELGPTIVKNSPSPPEKQQPFVFATTIYNFYLLLAWVPNLRSPSRAVWISLGWPFERSKLDLNWVPPNNRKPLVNSPRQEDEEFNFRIHFLFSTISSAAATRRDGHCSESVDGLLLVHEWVMS